MPQAAARETLEETGWHVVPTALIGVYRLETEDNGGTYVRFSFAGEAGEHDHTRLLDEGIVRAVWMSYDEIVAHRADHRSPLVLRCIDDYRAGKRWPLEFRAGVGEVSVQHRAEAARHRGPFRWGRLRGRRVAAEAAGA